MPRKPRPVQQVRPAAAAPHRPDEVLQAALAVLGPAVRLLLHAGVDYPHLAAALKGVFIEQAVAALQQSGPGGTDSAISVLSGVHRKDVRAWRLTGQPAGVSKPVAASARVFARWIADRAYADGNGAPRELPRTGAAPSFESLVRAVTQDVHPFTVLQELIRLGIARVDVRDAQEWVVSTRTDFVPPAGSRDALELLAANLADHAAAAVSNVLGGEPLLEQSVFAAGLTPASAARMHALARTLWSQARGQLIEEATRLHQADQASADSRVRVRIGSYFWSAPWESTPAEPEEPNP
ncbi:DUF6502 family protein [Ramlibacter sp.]|uniref:DUF6502 family protein n=1 Tax=Ramlibacter sp. TaxID=1917967 RepID=UPI00260D2A10|nr:DUF6502 family protein [Ramlibacter sp.]MDB5956118.1 hypothetical protein [Ramlibacter sp.]